MAAFPLYSPLICLPGWEPNFTAGSEPCTLQSVETVTKSRWDEPTAGLFRSVQTGGSATVNAIQINCVVTEISGGATITENVEFNYTDPKGVWQTTITFQQAYTSTSPCVTVDAGSPGTITPVQRLRSLLSAIPVDEAVLIMPEDDTANTGYVAGDDDSICPLVSFTTTLKDALGLPPDSTGIRTGPTYALMHIENAETEPDGSVTTVNALSEWDGVNNQWTAHPSTLYEVGDPAPCP